MEKNSWTPRRLFQELSNGGSQGATITKDKLEDKVPGIAGLGSISWGWGGWMMGGVWEYQSLFVSLFLLASPFRGQVLLFSSCSIMGGGCLLDTPFLCHRHAASGPSPGVETCRNCQLAGT